jgi:hypothetical protein
MKDDASTAVLSWWGYIAIVAAAVVVPAVAVIAATQHRAASLLKELRVRRDEAIISCAGSAVSLVHQNCNCVDENGGSTTTRPINEAAGLLPSPAAPAASLCANWSGDDLEDGRVRSSHCGGSGLVDQTATHVVLPRVALASPSLWGVQEPSAGTASDSDAWERWEGSQSALSDDDDPPIIAANASATGSAESATLTALTTPSWHHDLEDVAPTTMRLLAEVADVADSATHDLRSQGQAHLQHVDVPFVRVRDTEQCDAFV